MNALMLEGHEHLARIDQQFHADAASDEVLLSDEWSLGEQRHSASSAALRGHTL